MALQRFPGFIDIHVHLREPGATQKEDFRTGTRAAVAGGFTFVCDMPNNPGRPTVTAARLEEKISLSSQKAICDLGFHFGTDGDNVEAFPMAASNPRVYGLKVYCTQTTGELFIGDTTLLDRIFSAWKSDKPILVHAQGDQLVPCLELAKKYGRRLHVCHLSDIKGVELVRHAKERKQMVTAGVTPHHLFLKKEDLAKLGSFGLVKPPISGEGTRQALWEAVGNGTIDLVESDHAPHTKEEKVSGTSYFGVPGLETTIGLLVRAVVEKKLTHPLFMALLYERPKKIFDIPEQKDTFVELDPIKTFVVGGNGYETKCGWSPFEGWELNGPIDRVELRGIPLVVDGKMV